VARYRQCLQPTEPTVHLLTCWYYGGVEAKLHELAQSLSSRTRHGRMLACMTPDASDRLSPRIGCIESHRIPSAYLLQPVSRWQALEFPEFIDEYALLRILRAERVQHLGSEPATSGCGPQGQVLVDAN
jgi:hypothetical protein